MNGMILKTKTSIKDHKFNSASHKKREMSYENAYKSYFAVYVFNNNDWGN